MGLVLLAMGNPGAAPGASVTAAWVVLDGERLASSAAIVNGVSYLSLNVVRDTLGARVEWDPTTDAVAVNGVLLRALPFHTRSRVYLPIGAVARILKLHVRWVAARRSVFIDRNAVAVTPPAKPRPRPHPRIPSRPTRPRPTPPPLVDNTPPTPLPDKPGAWRVPFTPVSGMDGIFQIQVTDLVELNMIKGYYQPGPGNKFVQVSLSQQNVSNELQIYTGKFTVVDDHGQAYDPIENLSNFWLVILRPGGINFGYLIYVMPQTSRPSQVVLQAQGRSPLTVPLR